MSAFQITPFGLVIIGIYSLVICVIAFVLSRAIASFRWRWWVLGPPALLLMALPWGEEAWIAWHFKEACKSAGVKVFLRVEVQGFYDSTIGTGYSFIEDYGYAFMEEKGKGGKIAHTERAAGQWKTTLLDRPTARYHVTYAYQPKPTVHEEPIAWRIERVERRVIDSETGEILGQDITVKRRASVADAIWSKFIGSTLKICPSLDMKPQILTTSFPLAVLKPISKP